MQSTSRVFPNNFYQRNKVVEKCNLLLVIREMKKEQNRKINRLLAYREQRLQVLHARKLLECKLLNVNIHNIL